MFRASQWFRRPLYVFALVSCVCAGASLRPLDAECERVLDIPGRGRVIDVRDGNIYLAHGRRSELTLSEVPVGGAPGRTLMEDHRAFEPGVSGVRQISIGNEGIFYVKEPADSGRAREMRLTSVRGVTEPDKEPATLIQESRRVSITLASNVAYVVQRRPSQAGSGSPVEFEVLMYPLPRGPARQVAVLPRPFAITPCADGFSYRLAPELDSDIVHVRASDLNIDHISKPPSYEMYEWGSSLYWTSFHGEPEAAVHRVTRTSRDGTERTLLAEWSAKSGEMTSQIVRVTPEFVYLLMGHRVRDHPVEIPLQYTLCRLRLQAPSVLERLALLPKGAQPPGHFDRGHFYFTCVQYHENWLDWSPSGLQPRRTSALMRVPVPA